MSTMAFGMPFLVSRSMTLPCIKVTSPPGASLRTIDSPFSRKGASGDQNGPRIEDEVGCPDSEACLWAISSTRL